MNIYEQTLYRHLNGVQYGWFSSGRMKVQLTKLSLLDLELDSCSGDTAVSGQESEAHDNPMLCMFHSNFLLDVFLYLSRVLVCLGQIRSL